MSQAASRDRASSLQGGDKKAPCPQKATLDGEKRPRPRSKDGCKQGKQGERSQEQHAEGNREGERWVPGARHGDLLPEAEAAEEEEGERARAASWYGDGRFFHMAAIGRPGPIPAPINSR